MGCGILFTYPEIAAIAGVQGLLVYGLSSALPILMFAFLGPKIRRATPHGFVLTEWARERYGPITGLYLSFFTIATIFLYIVSELTSIQYCIESLTTMNSLAVMIVEAIITTIYTSWGGFHTSFITDNIQGGMVLLLLIICSIAMGTQVHIDTSVIKPSGLLGASKLGWQLIYIFPIAIATNDCFLSGFWLRTFASRSDKDLLIGTSIATFIILVFLVVTGVTGLLASWSGLLLPDKSDASYSFFYILLELPAWVVGFVLVFIVMLSTATFDSLESSMVSTISNDVFRNRLKLIWVRFLVVLVMIPSIVVATRAPNILTIFLISDLISAAVVPSLLLGLWSKMYFISGWEIIVSGLGGILSVFIFGTIYYNSALEGAKLIILQNGLYVDDWSAFGAFAVAPGGGLIFGAIMLVLRLSFLYIRSRVKGIPFTALDKPFPKTTATTELLDNEDDDSTDKYGATQSTVPVNNNPTIRYFDNFFDFDESNKWKSMFFVNNKESKID